MSPATITKSAFICLLLSLFLNHLVVGQTNLVIPKYRPHLYDSTDRTYFSSWQFDVKAENRTVFEPKGLSSYALSGAYYNRFVTYYKMIPEDPQDILYIFLDAFENDKDDFCHSYKGVRKVGLGMESYYRQQLPIMDKFCECVFAAYNPNLVAKLQRMNASEQRDRTSDRVDAKLQSTLDSVNCVEAKRIYSRYGFPDRRLVGVENERIFFRIIAHAKLPEMEEYLTAVRVAVEQGRLLPEFYAELFDQILVKKALPQEFGTQFQYNPKTGRNEMCKSIPMDQVNKNRKRYGLGTIEH